MNEPITLISKVETNMTPELLAKAFWAMDDNQQVEFFAALAEETKASDAYGYGEMQWCYFKDKITKNKEAYKQYLALSLWAYDFIPAKDTLECYL